MLSQRNSQGEDDVAFEEELSRNPYNLKTWWDYLESKRGAPAKVGIILHYEHVVYRCRILVSRSWCLFFVACSGAPQTRSRADGLAGRQSLYAPTSRFLPDRALADKELVA